MYENHATHIFYFNFCAIEIIYLPSSVREQVAELGDTLADSIGPVNTGWADPSTGPEVLLTLTSAKTHLHKI